MNEKQMPQMNPPGVTIIGQPFTLASISCPINAILRCNCGGAEAETTVKIVNSVQASCLSCGRIYNAAFNPTNQKVEMHIAIPKQE